MKSFRKFVVEIIVVLLWPLLALNYSRITHWISGIPAWFSSISDRIDEAEDVKKYGLSWEEFMPLERLELSPAFEVIKRGCLDNFGTSYKTAIKGKGYFNDNDTVAWKYYWLDGSYHEIRGRVVLNRERSYLVYDSKSKSYSKAEAYLKIFGDGILLYESQAITGGCEPQDFTVDISNVSVLRVDIQNCNLPALVDCGLYKDSSVPTVSTATEPEIYEQPQASLYELFEFNRSLTNSGVDWGWEITDNWGTTYSNSITLRSYHETKTQDELWSDYRINGRYSRIGGKVVLSGEAKNLAKGQYFAIYGDGELLYQSQPLTPECKPQEFNIDISGVTTLRIATNDPEEILWVVDCILYKDS